MSFVPLPTVKVRNPAEPDGFMIINESDLTDAHELWSEEGAPPPAPAETPPGAPAADGAAPPPPAPKKGKAVKPKPAQG